jgi:carboxymethylenebutenolidase
MRYALLALALAFAPAAAAQDWAKAKLEKSPRHGEWVKLKNGDREVNAFLVFPEVKDKATAVVVIHEIFGLTDWVRNVADQLAEAGYIAIAPDLLSGLGDKKGGSAELGEDGARRVIGNLPPDQITGDLNAAVGYVQTLPACNGKVVVGGFCWGGSQTFRFATNNKTVKAAFPFYGSAPKDEADLRRIECPIYGFFAGNDARVNATLPATAETLKKLGKKYEPVTYDGAGHGFMRAGEAPNASEANKKARDEAWKRWKELLAKV